MKLSDALAASPDKIGQHILEAEQEVLGAVLYQNETIDAIDGLRPEHFAEPLHQRLWAEFQSLIGRSVLVEPKRITELFKDDPAFMDLGGIVYLANLVDFAPVVQRAIASAELVKEASGHRQLAALGREIAERALAAKESTSDIVGHVEASLLSMQVTGRRMQLVSAREASQAVMASLDSSEDLGIPTGLDPLDEQLGAMQAGDLVLFMGRPSMGKSAAAECVALNIAERKTSTAAKGFGVIQINGEMSPVQMTRRHLTDICFRLFGDRGPKYSDIRKRAITAEQRDMLVEAHAHFEDCPIEMIKRPGIRLGALRSLIRRQATKWGREGIPLGAVIVDHVGLIRPDESMRDRYADQTIISNGLKELADELGCPLIALNQMNRQNENREDKRPQLADLRDSGSWEQDADIVIGWYREAYYANREAEPKDTGKSDEALKWAEWDRRRRSKSIEAIILKAREGECGTVELWGDVARNAIRGSEPREMSPFNRRGVA